VPYGEYPVAQVTAIPSPVLDCGAAGVGPFASSVAGQGSSLQAGNRHVPSALQVALPVGEYPTGQVALTSLPVGDSGTDGAIADPAAPSEFTASQGSSTQDGNIHVSSTLQVAVPSGEYPVGQVAMIPIPVGDVGTIGESTVAGPVAGQGSSLQVDNVHDVSRLQVAVSTVEYPVSQVTVIPLPVFDPGADGVVPLAAAVAGQGWSPQVGNIHVPSTLQVAVPDVAYPAAQVTSTPLPVSDSPAYGVVPLAGSVGGHFWSLQAGNSQVSSALQVAEPLVENPAAQVTAI
jgi:hypothetical protein